MKIDINPQEVMMIAEGALRDGWVQGKLKGVGAIDATGTFNGTQTGVCVIGALQEAITQVLHRPLEEMLRAEPAFLRLHHITRKRFLDDQVRSHTHALVNIFRSRIETVLGGTVEAWNDKAGRKKEEVLEAMSASLEIITQECIAAWQAEEEKTPTPLFAAK